MASRVHVWPGSVLGVGETETDSQASPSRHGTLFRDSMISATILFQVGSLQHLAAAFSSGACLDNRE